MSTSDNPSHLPSQSEFDLYCHVFAPAMCSCTRLPPCSRCGAPSSFLLQFTGTGTDSDNQYAVFTAYGNEGETFSVSPTTSAGDATVFATSDACSFGSRDLSFLADVSSTTAAAVFFDTPGNIRESGYITPTCKVAGGILSCDFEGATEFALCPDGTDVSALLCPSTGPSS